MVAPLVDTWPASASTSRRARANGCRRATDAVPVISTPRGDDVSGLLGRGDVRGAEAHALVPRCRVAPAQRDVRGGGGGRGVPRHVGAGGVGGGGAGVAWGGAGARGGGGAAARGRLLSAPGGPARCGPAGGRRRHRPSAR